jgi:hypothetical protein
MKSHDVDRGMRMLAAYFGTYIAVGLVYPIVVGESVFETSKKMGWKKEGQPKIDCQTYYDDDDRKKDPSAASSKKLRG